MLLSYKVIGLFRTVLLSTGATEVNPETGKEQKVPRGLADNDEVSQRRHFIKNTDEVVTKNEARRVELQKEIQALVKTKKEELKNSTKSKKGKTTDKDAAPSKMEEAELNFLLESDKDIKEFLEKVNKELNETGDTKHEIEVTPKTKEVLKKYFHEFGELNKWKPMDDEQVIDAEEALK